MILPKLKNFFGDLSIKTELVNSYFDRENRISKHFPIKLLLTPEIFLTADGEIGCVIALNGIPFEVTGNNQLRRFQQALGFALQQLENNTNIYMTTHRNHAPAQLEGDFPEGFVKDFMKAYQQQFAHRKIYQNSHFLTLVLCPPAIKKVTTRFIRKKTLLAENKENHDKQIKILKTQMDQVVRSLEEYGPVVIGKNHSSKKADLLRFFSIFVNGYARDFAYPYQEVASFIAEKRIFIGADTIHFQGISKNDAHYNRYGAILSIKHYHAKTSLGLLGDLLALPFEFISTHSFLPITLNESQKRIKKQINRLESVEDAAISQIDELAIAMDDVASNRIKFGQHHNTLLVLSDSLDELDKHITKVVAVYQRHNLVVVRETLNLEASFWAQIPGNFKHIRRQALINNQNLTTYQPLHNYYTGYRDQNHLGGALLLLETPSKTPMYFNIHQKGSGRKNNMTRGHTIIIGPSDAGKTVILATIEAASKKYRTRSFIFDRLRGLENYVRAVGGQYYALVPGQLTHFNPCQLGDTQKNRQFLRDLIKICSQSELAPLTAADYTEIANVVERNFTLPFEKRQFSNIASFFTQSFTGLNAFSRYLRFVDQSGKPGDLAYLFDNPTDLLNLNNDTIGFDLTHWLKDHGEPPAELLPLSMYLFHRMEETFDPDNNPENRPTGIYLDEGWQFLQHPYWSLRIQEYLVTLRKMNVFLLISTQQADRIAHSPIASSLLEGMATKIFLMNADAKPEHYQGAFSLSDRELEIVQEDLHRCSLNGTRYFLIIQQRGAAIAGLNFQGIEHFLSILSTNSASGQRVESLRTQWGDDPTEWVPIFLSEEKAMR